MCAIAELRDLIKIILDILLSFAFVKLFYVIYLVVIKKMSLHLGKRYPYFTSIILLFYTQFS